MKAENRRLAEAALETWGVRLEERQWTLLDNYLRDVLEYNRKVNLTAARDEGEVVRRHFLDALAGLAPLKEKLDPAPRLADIGAGGGFVGICLKIAWPEADVTLIESAGRKFKFLSWACARLGVVGLHVLQERAGTQRGFDAVLARAVAPLPELAKLALPMGRWLAAWQSELPGGKVAESRAYRLPGEEKDRYIVFLEGA
ncbi:MAG TPA: 16S rRNA (guanine(527)-N(7))-methyltransferase RsmG [Elusimicrobia bacterium]|nr:16S rRNA (guanine(527)-N(7))-methyltransferase RsmG [Elusimicrobiota bacterium]